MSKYQTVAQRITQLKAQEAELMELIKMGQQSISQMEWEAIKRETWGGETALVDADETNSVLDRFDSEAESYWETGQPTCWWDDGE